MGTVGVSTTVARMEVTLHSQNNNNNNNNNNHNNSTTVSTSNSKQDWATNRKWQCLRSEGSQQRRTSTMQHLFNWTSKDLRRCRSERRILPREVIERSSRL